MKTYLSNPISDMDTAKVNADKPGILLEFDTLEDYQTAYQVLQLFAVEGLDMVALRELPMPNLETRPGDVLVMTWNAATFASVPLAALKAGEAPEKIPAKNISHPKVNEPAVNAWWAKNKDGIVDKWLKNKGEIPHKKGGLISFLGSFGFKS